MSTGPQSQAGKDVARQNALTHGLTAETLLPLDDLARAEAYARDWARRFPPVTEEDHWLINALGRDAARADRCWAEETLLLDRQAARARDHDLWDLDERLVAARLTQKLAKNPDAVSYDLERTSQGCAVKIEHWEALLGALEDGGRWDDTLREIAFDLIGLRRELRATSRAFATVEGQRQRARVELDRLRDLRARVEILDAARRDEAGKGNPVPSEAVWRVRRYEQTYSRRMKAMEKRLCETHDARLALSPSRPDSDQTAPPVSPFEVEEFEGALEALAERPEAMTPAEAPPAPSPSRVAFVPVAAAVPAPVAAAPKPVGNSKQRRAAKRAAARASGKR